MARPSKLTPALAAGIVSLVEHCVPPVTAAGAFGVNRSTYYRWLQEGAEDPDGIRLADPIKAEFRDSIERAERQAESYLVDIAVKKARSTRDALDILARRFGGDWRERTEVRIDVRHILEGLTNDPAELEAAVREAEHLMGTNR